MCVVIKNLKTGISTECSNVDVIKICKADENYVVSDVKKKATKKSSK